MRREDGEGPKERTDHRDVVSNLHNLFHLLLCEDCLLRGISFESNQVQSIQEVVSVLRQVLRTKRSHRRRHG
jgi:hypothetical protein